MGASVQPQAAGAPSDADLWDQYVAQKVSPHEATARIEASHGAAPDVIWDKLVAQGAPADSATAIVGRVTGKMPPGVEPPSLAARVGAGLSHFAQHPISSIVGGVKNTATAANDAVLRPVRDESGTVHDSWAEDPIGTFGEKVLGEKPIDKADWRKAELGTAGTAAAVGTGGAAGGLLKGLGAAPWLARAGAAAVGAGTAGAANTPQDPVAGGLTSAIIGGAGSLAGTAAGAAMEPLATRARSAITDRTLKSETNAAYEGVRRGTPITDPAFLQQVNEFNQKPQAQDAFRAGQDKAFANGGRQVPDLPQSSGVPPRKLAGTFWDKLYQRGPSQIESITPEQVDAWKQGSDATGIGGAFKPILQNADPLMSGYAAARGLSEASREPTPGLAELKGPALKAAGTIGAASSGHMGIAGMGLVSLLADLRNLPKGKPLSPNAIAALRGVQQQVGDLPLAELYRQGGAAPAAFTGLSHMAAFLPPAAAIAAATRPYSPEASP